MWCVEAVLALCSFILGGCTEQRFVARGGSQAGAVF